MTQEEFNNLLRKNPAIRLEVRQPNGEVYTVPATVVSVPAPSFLTPVPDANPLAAKFERMWEDLGGPLLLREYKFHPDRKWRADYCHEKTKVLIELEGGVWSKGRHTRGLGFINDIEKYNAAALLGYRVLRIPTGGVVVQTIQEFIRFIETNIG